MVGIRPTSAPSAALTMGGQENLGTNTGAHYALGRAE